MENGERTGNVDLVTVAMNMFCHGVEPGLDFSRISKIRETYEILTGMKVHERTPYAGDLVFTAFPAPIRMLFPKAWPGGRKVRAGNGGMFPICPIDPADVGREYESDVIRINSQSGKAALPLY